MNLIDSAAVRIELFAVLKTSQKLELATAAEITGSVRGLVADGIGLDEAFTSVFDFDPRTLQ